MIHDDILVWKNRMNVARKMIRRTIFLNHISIKPHHNVNINSTQRHLTRADKGAIVARVFIGAKTQREMMIASAYIRRRDR